MSKFAPQSSDEISIATIRALAADVVGKANSGHPGAYPRMEIGSSARIELFYSQVPQWAWHLLLTSFLPGEHFSAIIDATR